MIAKDGEYEEKQGKFLDFRIILGIILYFLLSLKKFV